ncbi:ABC transporter substrate-binding protein [Mitsuokella sp. WILCCON 0060]|uniref:ABC transporter substrate-binding protein n=1 Tax=Mitsuokella sp. WILCCON 0060 TaxID=3345341 RepID=UPI003F1AC8D1
MSEQKHGLQRFRRPPRFLLGLLFAYLFVFLALCKMEPQPIILRVGLFAGSNWDVPQGNSYAYIDEVIAKFEAEHPNVKVVYQSGIRKEDYSEWLAGKALAGEMPDLFLIPQNDFNLYTNRGALAPLDTLAKDDANFELADFYPTPLAYGRSSEAGPLYALPVECVPRLMFVNRTLLSREGIPLPDDDWTWDDFLSICQKVTRDTDGDGRLDQFGVYGYTWQDAVITSGQKLFRADGKASYFANPRIEDAIRFTIALHQTQQGQTVQERDFDLGHVAFRPFSFAAYRTYQPYPWRIKKATNFEWDCIRLPRGPEGKNTSPIQTLLMGINAQTKQRQLAWEFLKAVCYEKENQQKLLTLSAALPVHRGIIENATSAELFGPAADEKSGRSPQAVSRVIEEGSLPDRFPQYSETILLADREIQKLIQGSLTETNAMNRLPKKVNDLLLK